MKAVKKFRSERRLTAREQQVVAHAIRQLPNLSVAEALDNLVRVVKRVTDAVSVALEHMRQGRDVKWGAR